MNDVIKSTLDEVTISRARYASLLHDEAAIVALEGAGVDNWEGYEEINWPKIDADVREEMESF